MTRAAVRNKTEQNRKERGGKAQENCSFLILLKPSAIRREMLIITITTLTIILRPRTKHNHVLGRLWGRGLNSNLGVIYKLSGRRPMVKTSISSP